MNKKLMIYLKVSITIILILVILSKVSIYYTSDVLSSIKGQYIPLMFFLYILTLLFTSMSLKTLFDAIYEKPISSLQIFKYYLMSSAIGTTLPGRLDNIIFIKYIDKYVNISSGIAISLANISITMGLQAIIAIIGLVYFFLRVIELKNILFFILSILILLLILKYFMKYKYLMILHVADFLSALSLLFNKKDILLKNIILTIIKISIHTLYSFLIFYSFGYSIGFDVILFINSITTIICTIPITINGLGLRETISIYLYSLFELPPELIISTSIISYLIIYTVSLLTIIIYNREILKN